MAFCAEKMQLKTVLYATQWCDKNNYDMEK
jgi:hypothetical protein